MIFNYLSAAGRKRRDEEETEKEGDVAIVEAVIMEEEG